MEITEHTLEEEIQKEGLRLQGLHRQKETINQAILEANGRIQGYQNMISHIKCPYPQVDEQDQEEKEEAEADDTDLSTDKTHIHDKSENVSPVPDKAEGRPVDMTETEEEAETDK